MVLIVFSDIHGNIYALEEAVKIMEKYKADQYLFLGDMAGYYYYQNECISLLKTMPNLISIKGNHDINFLDTLNDIKNLRGLDEKYGNSYSLLNQSISEESKCFFQSMKNYEKNSLYEAYHASPNDFYYEYIYPDTECKFDITSKYLFLGHTHHRMRRRYNDTIVINPGSIGQPRDTGKSSFYIIDIANKIEEKVMFTYNKEKLLKDVEKYDPNNKYLRDVLIRDRK